MIKVDLIIDKNQERNGKRLYMVTYKHIKDNSFFGGFVEYISPENMPTHNQKFETPRALENFCRGEA